MYLKVKQWMPHFTFKFWTICVSVLLVWGQKCGDRKCLLLHNDAHRHTEGIVQQFLAKKGVAQWSHPSYSPDLSLQLFCFPKIKIGAERWPFCFNRRHSEIRNSEIKSVPNFWLRTSYEMGRRSHQRVYSSVRRLFQINITYLNFVHFFSTVFAALS